MRALIFAIMSLTAPACSLHPPSNGDDVLFNALLFNAVVQQREQSMHAQPSSSNLFTTCQPTAGGGIVCTSL